MVTLGLYGSTSYVHDSNADPERYFRFRVIFAGFDELAAGSRPAIQFCGSTV